MVATPAMRQQDGSQRTPSRASAAAQVEPTLRKQRVARYSQMVQILKVLLPSIALLLLVAIAVWPHIQSQDTRFRIGIASLSTGDADQVGMLNPRYVGMDDQGRQYSVSADLARNTSPDERQVELEMPKADISLKDGTWLVLTANSGLYDDTRESLDLTGAVNLFHDTGYEIRTSSARVDLDRNVAVGSEPVEGQGPFGEMRAEGFEIRDRGRTILFTGRTSIVIYPGLSGGEDGS